METGKEKVDRICALLKEETIKPAQDEAKRILDEARKKADSILKEAAQNKEKLLSDTQNELDKRKQIFESSLALASKSTLESLRQSIEKNLFSDEMNKLIQQKSADEGVVSDFIKVVADAIEKEGLDGDIEAFIPKAVSKEKLLQLLGSKIGAKLNTEKVIQKDFAGGAQIKLVDQHLTIDLSDQALKELLASFLQKDYRQIIFNV